MRTIVRKTLTQVLKAESQLILWKYKPKVVAITGSVGKTSTKDAIYAVVSKFAHVRKSDKSYNSQLGLPLTILGVPNGWNDPAIWFSNIWKGLVLIFTKKEYPKWLVLEVGIGKPGDMAETASWLKTDVVVITAIGHTPPHIEFFHSREHLIQEKAGLIKTLKKDGTLILNGDDEAVLSMADGVTQRIVKYGFTPGVDVQANGDTIFYDDNHTPIGVGFKTKAGGNVYQAVIEGVFGRNHVYAALAALTTAFSLGFKFEGAVQAVKNYEIPPGRMRLLSGINGSLLIDDTYNSSPVACEAALETLREVASKRKIAVLGDMLELGKHTVEAHRKIGECAYESADILLVVGQRAESIKDGAMESGMKEKNIFEFSNSAEAGVFLKSFVKNGDLVLIKGSQGVRMERTVAQVLLDQDNKEKLLVRQDAEWLKRK